MVVEKWQLRLSGTGGQGVIKGAIILAQAALYDGFNAIQTQVYGPESRGGSTKGEVVISADTIYYPKVVLPNLVLCLSEQAFAKFGQEICADGLLILDSDYCDSQLAPAQAQVKCVPITALARDTIGNELCTNIVALGVILGLTNLVNIESVEAAIRDNFKPKVAEKNILALHLGIREGAALL